MKDTRDYLTRLYMFTRARAKKLGIESKDVSKAIQTLKKEGKVHSPKRCYWAPT